MIYCCMQPVHNFFPPHSVGTADRHSENTDNIAFINQFLCIFRSSLSKIPVQSFFDKNIQEFFIARQKGIIYL